MLKSERVYAELRRQILNGERSPDERLVVRSLAEEHEISDIPVREALQKLARDGLVEIQPYRGARVVQLSEEDIQEGLFIRGHLESLANQMATPHLVESDFETIDENLAEMREALLEADFLRYAQLNRHFHGLILNRCPYKRLVELIDNIWDGQSGYSAVFQMDIERLARSYEEHCDLTDALRSRDIELVAEISLTHKLRTADSLTASIATGLSNSSAQTAAQDEELDEVSGEPSRRER